MTKARLGLMP